MLVRLLSASVLLVALPAFSQGGPGFEHGPFGLSRTPVTNAPYSATFTSTSTEKLQDGTVLNESRTRTVYRDSLGRTREEVSLPARSGADASGTRMMITIHDPVAHTMTQLRPDQKVAVVHALPEAKESVDRRHYGGLGNGATTGTVDATSTSAEAGPRRGPRPDKNMVKTDLGSQTISGVVATGTRMTRTVPAGEMGNANAIVSTHEDWISPDLKIEVKRVDVDPFHGTRTTAATALSKEEPTAALFQVPVGYVVQQAKSHTFGHDGGPEGAHRPGDVPPQQPADNVPSPAAL